MNDLLSDFLTAIKLLTIFPGNDCDGKSKYKKWVSYLNLGKCDDLGSVKYEQVKSGKTLTLNMTLRLTAVNFE